MAPGAMNQGDPVEVDLADGAGDWHGGYAFQGDGCDGGMTLLVRRLTGKRAGAILRVAARFVRLEPPPG